MNKNRENMGILVGLLLTDGCVYSSRFIVFHNKSEAMHELFRKQVTNIFGNVHFTERIENNGAKRTQVTSKSIVKNLIEICNIKTFRRKQFKNGKFPQVKLPEFVKNLSASALTKFLRVIFSADGSISVSVRWHRRNKNWEIRRRLELTCKHPILRKDFLELIKNTGFTPRTSCENITLERKKDILKFAKDVRFVNKVVIGRDSKNWTGFEKNQILDLAVKTFIFKKKNLEKFKTKEEIIIFLKSQIHP